MNKEVATQNFKEAVNILNRAGAYWWAEAGTCLGIVREGDFIDHDSDIDFGVYGVTPFQAALIAGAFFDAGYDDHQYGTIDNGFEQSFSKNGVKVDIFYFYYDIKRQVLWHSAWDEGKQLFLGFTPGLFADLQEVRFRGETVYLPCPTDCYLIERYGIDWRIPNTNWNWAKDPKCLRKD